MKGGGQVSSRVRIGDLTVTVMGGFTVFVLTGTLTSSRSIE